MIGSVTSALALGPLETRTTAAVLFADLTGFGALTESRGDAAAAEVATRFAAMAEDALSGGAVLLKTLGDGVLVVGPDLASARATAGRLRELVRGDCSLPAVRAGICEGAVVWRNGDVFGATVNKAARRTDLAGPWEICVEELS